MKRSILHLFITFPQFYQIRSIISPLFLPSFEEDEENHLLLSQGVMILFFFLIVKMMIATNNRLIRELFVG